MSRSRLVTVLGVTTSVAALLRGAPALAHWNDAQEAHAARTRWTVIALRAGLARRDEMRRLVTVQRELIAMSDEWLLTAGEGGDSTASLSERVETAATEAGVQLMGVQPIPGDSAGPGAETLRTRVNVVGDLESLMLFLAAIECAPGRLSVREMLLAQPNVAIARSQVEAVRADLVLEALRLAPIAAEPSP